jgi:hypothetical protein
MPLAPREKEYLRLEVDDEKCFQCGGKRMIILSRLGLKLRIG